MRWSIPGTRGSIITPHLNEGIPGKCNIIVVDGSCVRCLGVTANVDVVLLLCRLTNSSTREAGTRVRCLLLRTAKMLYPPFRPSLVHTSAWLLQRSDMHVIHPIWVRTNAAGPTGEADDLKTLAFVSSMTFHPTPVRTTSSGI